MSYSPTQLTLKKWRDMGYTCAVVEKWNPHSKTRQDLFGFIDVICIGDGDTVAIQTTTAGHISDRVKKINLERGLEAANVRRAGWKIIVEGWRKKDGRWICREVDLTHQEELSPPAFELSATSAKA